MRGGGSNPLGRMFRGLSAGGQPSVVLSANYELALPPLRPAAAFWALLPPLPLPLLCLLRLLPLLFPTLLDEPGEFEIAAARDLLIRTTR